MRLISYADPERGPSLGVATTTCWLPAVELLSDAPPTMDAFVAANDAERARLAAAATAERIDSTGRPLADLALIAPVPRPGKVVAIGRNYREHAMEEGADVPTAPLIFAKWPSSVIGPGDEIRWDPELTGKVDYEAELAVVIGRRARGIDEADALNVVLGYTCLNDVSARDIQFGDGQWVRGKSLDTFCPMGPVLVTPDEIPDPQDLAISCSVGAERLQDARTSQMFFGVAAIISYCSRSFTLEPGDVIATGTPAGVGAFRDPPRFLADGDVVTVEIEGIGRLVNTCRVETAGATP
ncbi:MAG: fumarylacetoacetate hydrolase family protein [Chloroflexota bacterium]